MKTLPVSLLIAACAWGATPTGPEAGQKVPDFSLSDQNGKQQSLKTLAGPKGLVLAFVRSADW